MSDNRGIIKWLACNVSSLPDRDELAAKEAVQFAAWLLRTTPQAIATRVLRKRAQIAKQRT